MAKIITENIIKNIIIVFVLIGLMPMIQRFLYSGVLVDDKASAGSIIVVTSIVAVIACFGNFAFTYEKIDSKKPFQRYLAHISTGLFMLVIGISLIFTAFLSEMIMGYFVLIDVTLVLLYLACVGYDFWDMYRISG